MKRFLFALSLVLWLATVSQAQYVKVLSVAEQSGVAITSGVSSTTKVEKTFPGATVTIYSPSGSGTIATIYSASTGTIKANPFSASLTDATIDFFILPGSSFDIRISGVSGGVTITPFTRSGYTAVGTFGYTLLVCGGSNDTVLLDAADTNGGTIEIPKGITCASNSQTLSAALQIDNGGLLKANTGQTVTLTGPQIAGQWPIYSNVTLGTISYTGSKSLDEIKSKWFGVTCDGSTDDAAPAQAALNAAKSLGNVALSVPAKCQLSTTAKLQLNSAYGVLFGPIQPEGYAYQTSAARIIWAGSSGGTMFEMLGSQGCHFRGWREDLGTADVGVEIGTTGSIASSSNTVEGIQCNKATSDANTLCVGISRASGTNNEKMTVRKSACFFGGSINPATLTRGTCIQVGATAGMGVNAKNTLVDDVYWYGVSYGTVLWNGTLWSRNGESNYASIDYLINSGIFRSDNHYSENARQFVKGRYDITLIANHIAFGGWDNAYPIVQMTLPGSSGGSGRLWMVGNSYDAQAGVNAVDADSGGTYYINSDAATLQGNTWPNSSPTLSNFATYSQRSTSQKWLMQGQGTGATQIASTQTTVPTCSSNCGTSPSVVGSDSDMRVTMGATGVPASGFVVTFNGTWAAAPVCTVQMATAGMVAGKLPLTVVTSTTTISVVTNGTAPSTSDAYAIHCRGTQ